MTLAAKAKTVPHRYEEIEDRAGNKFKICTRCATWEVRAAPSCPAGEVAKPPAKKAAKSATKPVK